MQKPTLSCRKREENLQGCHFGNRAKCLQIINTGNLGIALSNQTGFVSLYGAIGFELDFEDPFAPNGSFLRGINIFLLKLKIVKLFGCKYWININLVGVYQIREVIYYENEKNEFGLHNYIWIVKIENYLKIIWSLKKNHMTLYFNFNYSHKI